MTTQTNVVENVPLSKLVPSLYAQPKELTDKNYPEWRDLIKPKTDDVCFKTVNWLPTFWDGVMTAQKEDKPILLWAMNGHPLACT